MGHLLRTWRATRGMSQLDLALRAGFSARHVSFIETGRSQPSRQALLVLAETLDVPLRERNQLLEAGGYADAYRETPLDAEEMAAIRGMLRFILDRHAPYARDRPRSLLDLRDGQRGSGPAGRSRGGSVARWHRTRTTCGWRSIRSARGGSS